MTHNLPSVYSLFTSLYSYRQNASHQPPHQQGAAVLLPEPGVGVEMFCIHRPDIPQNFPQIKGYVSSPCAPPMISVIVFITRVSLCLFLQLKLYKVSLVFSILVPGRFRLSHGVLGKALLKENSLSENAKNAAGLSRRKWKPAAVYANRSA
jgi:hypothetical protein